jgi:hypothetical protein
VIALGSGEVTAEVVPARGALVTALRIGANNVLYLDPATLADPTKNVRGGSGTVNTERRGWVPAGDARTYWMRIRA